jgi:hypothetical protein
MKVYDYRGQKVVLKPDAVQNTHENAVVQRVQPDPTSTDNRLVVVQGATELAFRHLLKETALEFTP